MHRRRSDPVRFQHVANLGRRMIVVPRELDFLVANLRKLRERTSKVGRRGPSKRVQLNTDALELCVTLGGILDRGKRPRTHSQSRESAAQRRQERPSILCHGDNMAAGTSMGYWLSPIRDAVPTRDPGAPLGERGANTQRRRPRQASIPLPRKSPDPWDRRYTADARSLA